MYYDFNFFSVAIFISNRKDLCQLLEFSKIMAYSPEETQEIKLYSRKQQSFRYTLRVHGWSVNIVAACMCSDNRNKHDTFLLECHFNQLQIFLQLNYQFEKKNYLLYQGKVGRDGPMVQKSHICFGVKTYAACILAVTCIKL